LVESVLLSSVVVGFSLIVAAVAFGSAIGDGIVSSKAVEAIARQPEARPNIFTFMFLGVGVLEAFPIIGLGLGLYIFFVVSGAPAGIPALLKAAAGHP
jgi:F-type H+-transporting ATPase subunit c